VDPSEHRFWAQLGKTIAVYRKTQGLTQQALAELVGTSRVSIANIEKARQRVNAFQLQRMARSLGVTVGALYLAARPTFRGVPNPGKD